MSMVMGTEEDIKAAVEYLDHSRSISEQPFSGSSTIQVGFGNSDVRQTDLFVLEAAIKAQTKRGQERALTKAEEAIAKER